MLRMLPLIKLSAGRNIKVKLQFENLTLINNKAKLLFLSISKYKIYM